MIVALTTNSIDRVLNYENYETIGDAILKFMTGLVIF